MHRGWGYLRIEHKAPQDTDAICLLAHVCLYRFWELTPCLHSSYEQMDQKPALQTTKVKNMSTKDLP